MTKTVFIQADEKAIIDALNALPVKRRTRLIGDLCQRLAYDMAPEGQTTDRLFLMELEAGTDSTMWGEDLEAEYDRQPFSNLEELQFALFGVHRLSKWNRWTRHILPA
jgi:hypothetical protein